MVLHCGIGYILSLMMIACSACNRPVPLAREEIALLSAARCRPCGLRLAALPPAMAACVRPLVRMGYMITGANDDGEGGRMVLITDRGRAWLADNAS